MVPTLVTSMAAAAVAKAAVDANFGDGTGSENQARVELRTLYTSPVRLVYKAPAVPSGIDLLYDRVGWKPLSQSRQASVAQGTCYLQQYYLPDDAFNEDSWYRGVTPFTLVKLVDSEFDTDNIYWVEKRRDTAHNCWQVAWFPTTLAGAERLQAAINSGDSTNWQDQLEQNVDPKDLDRGKDYGIADEDKTILDRLGEWGEEFMKDPVKAITTSKLFIPGCLVVGGVLAFKLLRSATGSSALGALQRLLDRY